MKKSILPSILKKTIILILPIMALSIMLLQSCAKTPVYVTKTFFLMDTVIEINLGGYRMANAETDLIFARCAEIIEKTERAISRTIEKSDVSRLNSTGSGEGFTVSKITAQVIAASLDVAEATGGAFDPSIGALSDLWDITGGGGIPDSAAVANALERTGYEKIRIDGVTVHSGGVSLDLGAIGKGYAAAAVAEYLREAGVEYSILSFGGNISVTGVKPGSGSFKIGIRDPDDPSGIKGERTGVAGYVYINDAFVSVSGDYERYKTVDGVKYHHIFDPATGTPADSGLHSVAVISPDGTIADALSTALFVMGASKGLEFYDSGEYDFEAVFITADNKIVLTAGLTDNFELSGNKYEIAKKS